MTRWFLYKAVADEIVKLQTQAISGLALASVEKLALDYANLRGMVDGLRAVIDFDPFAEDEDEGSRSR